MAMFLLILKVYLFTGALLAAISSIEEVTVITCSKIDIMLNQSLNVVSQINRATYEGVQYAMESIVEIVKVLLSLCITVVKSVIGLIIEIYLGTLACLCTAFVKGTLEFVADIASVVTEGVEDAINFATESINTALSQLSTIINGFIKGLEAIKSLFSSDSASLTDALTSVTLTISALKNVSIPTTFVEKIANLSDSIPDFEDVLSNLTILVTLPLDVLDTQVKQLSITESFQASGTNIQSFNVLGETCQELENIFDEVIKTAQICSNYVLIGLGVATCLLFCFLIWMAKRTWKRNSTFLESLAQENLQLKVGNLIYEHENVLLQMVTKTWDFRLQWLVNYMNTHTLMRCAMMGTCGLICFGLQSMILNYIERKLERFVDIIIIEDGTKSQITKLVGIYFNETQSYIDASQKDINLQLLKPVQQLSTDLYSTILTAESAINNTVNSVFGGSPFAAPLQTIIYCTIGRKIDTIEKALKWLVSNTELTFLEYSDTSMMSVSSKSVDDVFENLSNLADNITSATEHLIKQYRKILQVELIVSSSFLGVWFLMLIIGCGILVVREIKKTDTRPQVIGVPRQIGEQERRDLGCPFRDPFTVTASSIYSEIPHN